MPVPVTFPLSAPSRPPRPLPPAGPAEGETGRAEGAGVRRGVSFRARFARAAAAAVDRQPPEHEQPPEP